MLFSVCFSKLKQYDTKTQESKGSVLVSQSSKHHHSGTVVSPAFTASPVLQGYQAVTDGMAVKELKVTEEAWERLGLRDLLE